MRLLHYSVAVMCAIIVLFSATGLAQSDTALQFPWDKVGTAKPASSVRIGGGVVSREQFGFYWETRVEPATPAVELSASATGAGTIHRILLDRSGRTYFGYDVLIDTLPQSDTYRVTFQPLVLTSGMAQEFSMDRWSGWTPLAAPRFPAPQTVRRGQILELTLLSNSATNQRIVDYISVQEPARETSGFERPQMRDFSYATGSARDITAGDIEMRIAAPRVSVNGTLEQASTSHFEAVEGPFVWIYIPNHGRFVLSLAPHPEHGFVKAGEVRGSSLQFQIRSDTYTVSSGVRIAPGQAAFSLYVLHEPDWKPTYLFADILAFVMGATDRFDSLTDK